MTDQSIPIFSVTCEHCSEQFEIPERFAGNRIRCPECEELTSTPLGDRDPMQQAVLSEGGAEVILHEPVTRNLQPARQEDPEKHHQLDAHIKEYFGEPEMVYHEVLSHLVHIDVHLIDPTGERPFRVYVTTGMSDRPMTLPPQIDAATAKEWQYLELLMVLPADHEVPEEWEVSTNDWACNWLRMLARFPHEYETWFGMGHTFPNGDPPEPITEGTDLCGFIFLMPLRFPPESWQLTLADGRKINFLAVVPLYQEERQFKLKRGVDPLLDRFDKFGVDEMIDLDRPNVCRKTKRFGLF